MIPFLRINENYSIGIGCEASYGCLECGHKALSFRITVLLWVLDFGIEFK